MLKKIRKFLMKRFGYISKKPIHEYFRLTDTPYFVIQRSILQSMPIKWQEGFVNYLNELDTATKNLEYMPSDYSVRAKINNKFTKDIYVGYGDGNSFINLNTGEVDNENL